MDMLKLWAEQGGCVFDWDAEEVNVASPCNVYHLRFPVYKYDKRTKRT